MAQAYLAIVFDFGNKVDIVVRYKNGDRHTLHLSPEMLERIPVSINGEVQPFNLKQIYEPQTV